MYNIITLRVDFIIGWHLCLLFFLLIFHKGRSNFHFYKKLILLIFTKCTYYTFYIYDCIILNTQKFEKKNIKLI